MDPRLHEVSLTFRAPAGEGEFGLRALAVEYLLINEFLDQNIVHELRILGKDSDPQDVRDLLTVLLFDQTHASEGLEPTAVARLDAYTAAVVEEQKVLLEIEPVYGVSVLLLAGSVEWLDLKADEPRA